MAFCSQCGSPLDTTSNFCRNCGAPVNAPVAPAAPQVPVAPSTSVVYEAAPVAPEVPAKAKAMGFVGMGLGIGGLVMAVIGLIYTLMVFSLEYDSYYGSSGAGFGMAVIFGIFSLPLCIVAGVLCNKAEEAGNFATPVTVGSKLRVAGIIVSAVMFFFGFISLAAM